MSQKTIDQLMVSTEVDPSLASTNTAVKVNSLNIYKFMEHSYDGSDGYRDGTYLIPHPREVFFESRKELCFYRNFLRPIVRAMIEPVFNQEAVRKIADGDNKPKGDSLFADFINDCDNAGQWLQDFTKEAIEYSRLHGMVCVVMDNSIETPKTRLEAKDQRKFPYVYLKKAYEIAYYKTDKFGNLIEIVFTEDQEDSEYYYRKWTAEYSVCVKQTGDGYEEIGPRFQHNLGTIPVIILYSTKRKTATNIFVDPPLYDIAKLNHAIFNKDAEIRDQERSQGFSVFYVQSDNVGNLTLGDKNVLFVPTGSTLAPGFASPDPTILRGLIENGDKMREDLFRMAEQQGVTGVQSGSSGVAMQWDFFSHESVLQRTSYLACTLEEKIADLFMLYTNEDFIYIVEYPEDFQPNNKMDELKLYDLALTQNPPVRMRAKIQEKIAHLLFNDSESEEDIDEIIEEIKQDAEDELASDKLIPDMGSDSTSNMGLGSDSTSNMELGSDSTSTDSTNMIGDYE